MSTNRKMDYNNIDKPHDKLVKRILANIVTVREILETYLPSAVKTLLDGYRGQQYKNLGRHLVTLFRVFKINSHYLLNNNNFVL